MTVDALFRPLRGRYVWWVRVGEGALLTFEVGSPRLEIEEVRHDGIPHRAVRPRGQWQLSLGECSFVIRIGDEQATDRSEAVDLAVLAELLDGQALLNAHETEGVLTLEFDLGAVVEVRPLDDESVAWVLASERLWAWRGELVRL